MTETTAGELAAERMQRLLSRAVEEQVSEQRQATGLLTEVRTSLSALEQGLRAAASQETVDRLDSSVSTVVADVRTSTALLSQRLEALSARVETIATESAAPVEQTSVRLGALAAELSGQADAIGRLQDALRTFEAFPAALASLQREISGLHDRLAPLGDLQAAVSDAGARTVGALDALRPQLDALAAKVAAGAAGGGAADAARVRDAVVDALGQRLEGLEEAASRPVVTPEMLTLGLGDLRASVRAAVGEQLEDVTDRLGALQQRVDAASQAQVDVGTGPDLSGDVERLSDRLEELAVLPGQVEAALAGISALRSDTSVAGIRAALETFADGAAHLSEQVARITVPSVDDMSTAVSARVADRLVEVLAPRIADVVLTRVSAALVTQLGEALAPRLREETDVAIRSVVTDSEARVLAHVDESVLALAEALLRRKGLSRPASSSAAQVSAEVPAAGAEEAASVQPPAEEPLIVEPVHEVVARLADETPDTPEQEVEEEAPAAAPEPAAAAEPEPPPAPAEVPSPTTAAARAAVTTGLAPTPVVSAPAPAPAKAEPAKAAAPKATGAKEAPAKAEPAKGTTRAATKPAAAKAAAPRPAKAAPSRSAAAEAAPARSAPARPAAGRDEGGLRPARPTRNMPILDRTPDLEDNAFPAVGRPAPAVVPRAVTSPAGGLTDSRPGTTATPPVPPQGPPPAAQPMPAPQPQPQQGQESEKKRRWWRGGE